MSAKKHDSDDRAADALARIADLLEALYRPQLDRTAAQAKLRSEQPARPPPPKAIK